MSEYINFNETSIANLKKAEDMNVNDYFLIQPQDFNNQAMILSYKNLILGLDNVSFANTITQHTTDIAQLSTATNNISSVDITGLIERCNDLQRQINNINSQKIQLPVGFVICLGSKDSSEDSQNSYTESEVNELFGGTWIRFAQGRMLIGSEDDTVSDTNPYKKVQKKGGNESGTVTLTIEQMPKHTHGANYSNGGGRYCNEWRKDLGSNSGDINMGYTNEFVDYTGEGKPINIMPPYIVVDMWKKISNESPTE